MAIFSWCNLEQDAKATDCICHIRIIDQRFIVEIDTKDKVKDEVEYNL